MKQIITIIACLFGIAWLGYSLFIAFGTDKVLFNQLLTCSLILALVLIIRLNTFLSSIKSETRASQSHKSES
jgi:hypothetical protein